LQLAQGVRVDERAGNKIALAFDQSQAMEAMEIPSANIASRTFPSVSQDPFLPRRGGSASGFPQPRLYAEQGGARNPLQRAHASEPAV